MKHAMSPVLSGALSASVLLASGCGGDSATDILGLVRGDDDSAQNAALVAQGKQIFRFDTFGDETQWTDTLRMHEVIRTAVDPMTALSVGLKVDAEALPPAVVQGIQDGSINLNSPDTTVALLKLNAVVGFKARWKSSMEKIRSRAWASPARCAIRPWTIPSRPASASGSTAGPIATSIPAPSLRCRRR